MTKLAMLCCLKSNRRCTGAACLSTLNDRTRSFAPYEGQEVTLTAFARCNGCEAGIDEGFQEKLDRLVEEEMCIRDRQCPQRGKHSRREHR